MFSSRDDSPSAIMFFEQGGVVKELLYSEFEAMLDAYSPEKEWAGREAKAAYLELGPDLSPKAAVFFKVSFDAEGWIESSWNVPLVNLARTARPLESYPSLRAATARSCSEKQYTEMLWTPDLGPGSRVLQMIIDALAVNRLGLTKSESSFAPTPEPVSAPQPTPAPKVHSPLIEQQLQQLLASQMQNASGVAATMAELEKTKAEYEQKLQALQTELAEKVRLYHNVESQLAVLQEQVSVKDRRIQELKQYYELKLEKTRGDESDYIKALREHYEKESAKQLADAESEYKELVNWREVELLYRAEKELQLHAEIASLRQRNAELAQSNHEDLLHTLSAKGITFMTYQVGLGHISIPVDDIPLYLSNPVGFVAAYCNVKPELYIDWLAHYHAPVCRIIDQDGDPCGADVERIDTPEHFMLGLSDCCDKHRKTA